MQSPPAGNLVSLSHLDVVSAVAALPLPGGGHDGDGAAAPPTPRTSHFPRHHELSAASSDLGGLLDEDARGGTAAAPLGKTGGSNDNMRLPLMMAARRPCFQPPTGRVMRRSRRGARRACGCFPDA